jgi:hypothetical protein
MRSSDRVAWYLEWDLSANDYKRGFVYWFIDSGLGCGKVPWIINIYVGFCYGLGLWKSVGG